MKRYIRAYNDAYGIKCIDSRYGDTSYLGKNNIWYNRPYNRYITKYSKSGAYSKVKQLNAENTDDSLRYEVEKLGDILPGR